MSEPRALTERISSLETGLAHMAELAREREARNGERFRELLERNRVQDLEAEKLAEKLGAEIKELQATLWSGLKWLGGLLAVTLLSIVLNKLGLV